MTDVLAALEAGNANSALEALSALEHRERRKLAPKILKLDQRWRSGEHVPDPAKRHSYSWQYADGTDAQRAASLPCVLLVATARELVGHKCLWGLKAQDVIAASATFRPPWLDAEGIDTLVAAKKLRWSTLEELVAAGLCERPSSDTAIEAMVEQLGFRSDRPLVELLRDAEGLIGSGLPYRLFEVEGGQQSSPAAADKYRGTQNKWATALATLSETGELDRARLLDACLDALQRDFASFRAGWFSRFHDQLAPTEDERAQRAASYLRLLGSTIGPTVSFALKATERLFARGRIDPGELLAAIGPALAAPRKGTVKRALKLLNKATAKDPRVKAEAVTLAFDALLHTDPEVQARALDFIEQHLPDTGDREADLRRRWQDSADLLAPSLRGRVSAEDPPVEATPVAPAVITALDDSLRITPAPDLERALEQLAYALEHDGDPIAQEQALDAIARHAPPPDDLAGPVRKRAASLFGNRRTFYDHPMRGALAYVALAWTRDEAPQWDWDIAPGQLREYVFHVRRVEALAQRILAGRSPALLSTPTHRSGFVEPAAFHARLDAWTSLGIELDPYDTVLALMRLPADAVAEARERLGPEPAYDLAASDGRWEYAYSISSRGSGKYIFHSIEVEPTEPIPGPESYLPLWHALRSPDRDVDPTIARWIATATPRALDAHFATGLRHLGNVSFDDTRASAVHLEAARDPWVELGTPGHWLLLAALASRGTRAIEVALDVGIDGITQGRIDPMSLGTALATLLPSGMLKAKRLAKNLATVAEASPTHAALMAQTIAAGLRGAPDDAPRDVGALLSLLHELLVSTGTRVEDAQARAWLEAQSRGGQVAKARKAILGL